MRKDRAGKPDLPLALAGLLGQVGCVTIVIIFIALGVGLWLDSQFSSRPLFTLILVIGSVPVTIYLMVRIVLTGMAKIQREPEVPPGSAGPEVPQDSAAAGLSGGLESRESRPGEVSRRFQRPEVPQISAGEGPSDSEENGERREDP